MIKKINKPFIKYCKKCVASEINLMSVSIGEDGICTACKISGEKYTINWQKRWKKLKDLAKSYKKKENFYDCVIPVSGGKDSYYQTHIIKNKLGLKPLLVTYHSNNYSKTGMENLINMREVFGVDHIFFTPSIKTLKTLNRLGMLFHGDMNWHGHSGILTYPIIIAIKFKIPLIVWGEHGFAELGGMHSHDDFIEFNKRERKELGIHNLEWYDFLKVSKKFGEKLEKRDLYPYIYPSDKEINEINLRGIYLSNFVKWDPNKNTQLMKKKYNFKPSPTKFDRTYRRISNLDDIHENGIHDYLKYIKFGYGRCTDHCNKDIRLKKITKAKAIKLVNVMDKKIPSDLKRWCNYVGWNKEKFLNVADKFRDPKVWWIKNNYWYKDTASKKNVKFEKVRLNKKEYKNKYFIEN